MTKILMIHLMIWGGVGLLLYGLSVIYIMKTFKELKAKKFILSGVVLCLIVLSFIALYRHFGINLLAIIHLFLIVNLMILSVHDLMKKQLPLEWLIFMGVFGIFFLWINPNLVVLETILSTLVLAGGMMLITKITHRGIGEGDVVVIALICLILGWKIAMMVLLLSFLIIGCLGLGLLLLKRVNKKTTLPFVPFVLFVILLLEWL